MRNLAFFASLSLLVPALLSGCTDDVGTPAPSSPTPSDTLPGQTSCNDVTRTNLTLSNPNHTVVALATTKGCIVAELYDEKASITANNFKNYTSEGFYTDLLFHRVLKGFVIQSGGVKADGTQKEPTHPPVRNEAISSGLKNLKYTFSMARTANPDSATSQFFINTVDNPDLDPGGFTADGYAVFGIAVAGRDVVHAIENVPVKTCPATGEKSCPVDKVYFHSARIVN